MPKDEFDFDDPMELNGVGLVCNEDTTEAMTECFVEEFMRLGYNHKQILAMFRNPHYIGMNMALQNRGEQFVRDTIVEVFARWGRPVAAGILPAVEPGVPPGGTIVDRSECVESSGTLPGGKMPPSTAGETPAATTLLAEQRIVLDAQFTDPMGAPIPDLAI